MDNITTLLTQYYGLDWAAMILGLSSYYLITKRNRFGFALQAVASILGCVLAVLAGQGGFIVSNIIFIAMASYGYVAWSQQQQQEKLAPVTAIIHENRS